MSDLLRYMMFILLSSSVIFAVLFQDKLDYSERDFVIQKVFKAEDYRYWAKVDGELFCKDETEETASERKTLLLNLNKTKTNIIYLTNVDILGCNKYLPYIAQAFHNYGFLLAIDLEKNFNIKEVLSDDFKTLNTDNYLNKIKEFRNVSGWVSYIIIDKVIDGLTFAERRTLQVVLREVFNLSFIGFRFTDSVKPTPEMKHPLRQEVDWSDFLPRDDDGDFVITTFPVPTFKRTAVYSESANAITSDVDGQFIELK